MARNPGVVGFEIELPKKRGIQIGDALGYSKSKGGAQADTPFGVKKQTLLRYLSNTRLPKGVRMPKCIT